ncbi:BQ2448_3557 [Microbotryum intermedium]|uniref:BQ2448_3557 protein n=1 Tax=Microbotryum intermedium TaxID=269621 RepID=A0A238FC66_9BASI|nr:BQ2448_3557 [Microbotryum intermedium]
MPPSHFGEKTTAQEAADYYSDKIKGKVVLITGGSPGGLGAEAARVIALHEPKLIILAGRSKANIDRAMKEIQSETPSAPLRPLLIDLACLSNVREASKEVLAYEETIDVLINNAGIMGLEHYTKTVDGYEAQFATCHLGHFLLTGLIRPRLAANCRIVNVSSRGHVCGPVRFDDINFSEGKDYDPWLGYGQAKTANMLFSVELKKRWNVPTFSLHPGGIMTNLARNLSLEHKKSAGIIDEEGNRKVGDSESKDVPQGTSTHIVAAFDDDILESNGGYLEDCQLANDVAREYALSGENAAKLWEMSEKLVGEKF